MPIHSSPAVQPDSGGAAKLALGVALILAWTNLLTTGRWADEPGALHGRRLWPYVITLAVATLVTLLSGRVRGTRPTTSRRPRRGGRRRRDAGRGIPDDVSARLWNQIPFYDDWPGLLQLTLNGIDTLKHGALVGWQWAFLGGYQTSADLSQSLAVPAWLPIALAGPTVGFHVFLALVTLAIPLAVWLDIRASDGATAGAYAGGFSAIVTGGYFATVMHSGMGNSTAGAASVALALMASHAARRGKRWGGPLLAAALTLALYSHAAFFVYATVCLAVEVLFYRDWRGGARAVVALGVAFVAALPLHWELMRYPTWFVTNNLYFEAPPSFDWPGLMRQIWWATEILALPWRWFNDYGGLTHVFLVVLAWMAWHDRTRAGFYAWATLAIVLTLRFNSPQIGLVAGRQLHLLPVLVAPALAGFICRYAPGGQAGRLAVAAVVAMFVAVPYTAVPHVPDVRQFNPALVDRIQQAGGHLVLVENNPHWDMISDRPCEPSVRGSTCTSSRCCRRRPASSSSASLRTAIIAAASAATRSPAAGSEAWPSTRCRAALGGRTAAVGCAAPVRLERPFAALPGLPAGVRASLAGARLAGVRVDRRRSPQRGDFLGSGVSAWSDPCRWRGRPARRRGRHAGRRSHALLSRMERQRRRAGCAVARRTGPARL